jgi:hypothetical protein
VEFLFDSLYRVSISTEKSAEDDPPFTCKFAGTISATMKDAINYSGSDSASPLELRGRLGSVIVRSAAGFAEKEAASLIGGLIRGFSIVSLSNETVAEVLTAILSVVVKKTAESIVGKSVVTCLSDGGLDSEQVKALLSFFGITAARACSQG